MNPYTTYIIQNHTHWISRGITQADILKIHSKVWEDNPFENITISQIQKKKGYTLEHKEILEVSEFEKLTFLFLNYSEHLLDLSFLKYCVNLEEIIMPHQKLKNLDILANLDKLKKIDANNNEIENIDCLYAFKNLEELNIEFNPINSLKSIARLKQLKKIRMDEIRDEKEIFEIFKNNKDCLIKYILIGGPQDFENFIFPKYFVVITTNENNISITLEAINDNFEVDNCIEFPKTLKIQPDFDDKYIAKIKQEVRVRLEKITGNTIQINDKKLFRYNYNYHFEYKHELHQAQ